MFLLNFGFATSGFGANFLFYFLHELRFFAEEFFDGFATLTESFAIVFEEGAGLVHDAVLDSEVEHVADFGDAFVVHDVKLGGAERCGDFVFDDFDLCAVAGDIVAFFDLADATNVETDGSVKLEGVAASGGLRIAKHDANFHADLVDENDGGFGLADDAGELAHGLRHEASLETHLGVAHVAVNFSLGDEGGDGVNDDDVDGVRADESFANFEGLFAVVGLRNEEVGSVNADAFGVSRIKGVLGVNEGRGAALFLDFGDGVESQSGLAGRFGAVNLDDAPLRVAAAESKVERERAGRDELDVNLFSVAEFHDGAVAERFGDLGDSKIKSLFLGVIFVIFVVACFFHRLVLGHNILPRYLM